MIADTTQKKKRVLTKLIHSGINVTPSILDIIINSDNPGNLLDSIIKEVSFIPSFNGYLTTEVLRKTSNDKIQNVLKRAINKGIIKIQEQDITEKTKQHPENSNSNNKITKSEKVSENNVKASASNSKQVSATKSERKKEHPKPNIKTTSLSSSKASLRYNPIAKEFESQYSIKRDPTGKLYTSGDYDDFYELTLDKFNSLYNLMKKRPEAGSATNINNITRLSESAEISIIGIVSAIRQTQKGNYFITIEDTTGTINAIIRKNSSDQDIVRTAEKTIEDQMVFIKGTYNPGKDNKRGIIFADTISRIDIPMGLEPKLANEPVSILLLSDLHIGSREFEEKLWLRLIKFLNGNLGNSKWREVAGKIKYIIINGDLVDGIGVYPNQEEDLIIPNIYKQYKKAAELIEKIPEYIKVFYSSGNHEPVRNAIPRPAVPKKYCSDLHEIGVKILGNPCIIDTHGVDNLVYHGDSLLDLNLTVPGLEHDKPYGSMKELMICRHLAPTFGKKTQIAPTSKDWLVIDEVPQIFHTGHLHIYGEGKYRGVEMVNSGCFQEQTDFMKSLGIQPTPGRVPIIELDSLNNIELDLKKT
ncbi:MAG: DNA-directed DNA polymerase II small subunit [Candidatus Lokiarchaeota archaeon]|nr:DNA-directed DNA polymerase II small subunit [Candidatus Lokiarchaeota archaeon]MBD3201865.1 DNA-directed DNA polymerase II small subunit [Candidatus Lokiarchaeota archaeon]